MDKSTSKAYSRKNEILKIVVLTLCYITIYSINTKFKLAYCYIPTTVGSQVILLFITLIDKLLLRTNTVLVIKDTKFIQNNLAKTFSSSSGKPNKIKKQTRAQLFIHLPSKHSTADNIVRKGKVLNVKTNRPILGGGREDSYCLKLI